MASNKEPRKFLMIILSVGIFPLVIGIIQLVMGIRGYGAERLQRSRYTESTCEIIAAQSKSIECSGLLEPGTCYVPAWRVKHSGPKFINANMASEGRYNTMAQASLEVNKYEVVIFSC